MTAPATTSPVTKTRSVSRPAGLWRSMVLGVTVMVGYLLSVVAANVATVHWAPFAVGGLLVPAGTLFAGASLTARDLVHDALGGHGVVAGIVAGTVLSTVFGTSRIAVASVLAFTASEVLDALVYTRLRHRTRLGAVAASNAVGLVVDTALFVPLAFGSLAVVPGQIVGKTVATLLTLAALHVLSVARKAARRLVWS